MNYEYEHTRNCSIAGSTQQHISFERLDPYNKMSFICENIFNVRTNLNCLMFMKSGEIIINPDWQSFNGRIMENTLINSLGELEDVKAMNVRNIMNDYDENMLISNQIMERVNSVGFDNIEVEFKGIMINLFDDLLYVVATTLIEIVGENADSIYNALELMK